MKNQNNNKENKKEVLMKNQSKKDKKTKIIKCEHCGYEIKGPEDIIYAEDATDYYYLFFKHGELHYERKDSEAWEFGQYLCGSCYKELPIQTEPEMIEYLKSISKSRR